MEFFEVVAKRRSYRAGFEPHPVPREDLQKIVQAGLDAPSGMNLQTTEFVIIDDPSVVRRIQALHQGHRAMQQASAYIACCVDTKPEPVVNGQAFQIEDCSAAVENILLAITALGYAGVWIDGWLRREQHGLRIGEWIGLPAHKTLQVLVPVGRPGESCASPKKRAFSERVWMNRYGGNGDG